MNSITKSYVATILERKKYESLWLDDSNMISLGYISSYTLAEVYKIDLKMNIITSKSHVVSISELRKYVPIINREIKNKRIKWYFIESGKYVWLK